LLYGSIKLDGRMVAGLMAMGDNIPPQMQPNWLAYFGTGDLGATRAGAQELGGSVRVEQIDVPAGSFSVLADPHGAVFAVWQGTFDAPPPG
jgi:predicted enzyme related to lactoylglutathione lyase